MIKVLFVFYLLLSWSPGALAAVWQGETYLLPRVDLDTQLSSTGRAACVDAEGTICVLLRSRQENGFHRLSLTREVSPQSWSDPVMVSTTGNAIHQSLSADSEGGLHAVWQDNDPFPSQIKYQSTNQADIWSAPEVLSDRAEPSQEPVMCIDSLGRVHCVWIEENPLASQLLHTWKPLGGEWSPVERLPLDRNEVHAPTISAGPNGLVHLVFVGNPPTQIGLHLYHVTIDVSGKGMSEAKQLTRTESRPQLENPFIESSEDGTVYMLWMDNRFRSSSASYDIYLRRYLPDVGWGHEKRVTYTGTTHGNPAIFRGPNNSWNITFESIFSGNGQVAYRQITPEFGWDPKTSRLTGVLRAAEDPHVLSQPNGELLLLWSEADDNGVKQVHALEGTVRPQSP